MSYFLFFFFFQAEDGIRDLYVTGVQTCALPILRNRNYLSNYQCSERIPGHCKSLLGLHGRFILPMFRQRNSMQSAACCKRIRSIESIYRNLSWRSEERRVGKECRCRTWTYQYKK